MVFWGASRWASCSSSERTYYRWLGAFLGEQSAVRGWIVHLGISLFNGVGFAVVLGYPAIRDFTASFDTLEYVLSGFTLDYAFAGVTIGVLPPIFELPWATDVIDPLVPRDSGPTFVTLLPATVFAAANVVYGPILGRRLRTPGRARRHLVTVPGSRWTGR